MIAAILPVIGPLISDVISRVLPEDANKRAEIEREVNMALVRNSHQMEQAAASVVMAEAKSEHFLTSTWRPILMLTITAVVGWNYLLAPLTSAIVNAATGAPVTLTIPLPSELWDLLMLGVGGYVIGRSGEKIAATWKGKG